MTIRKPDLPFGDRAAPARGVADDREGGRAAIADPLAAVAKALEGLRYGAIHLVVHDGKAVQLEVTERRRFNL